MFRWILSATLLMVSFSAMSEEAQTYAEKLGFPKGARVAIFHSDDLGMFIDANRGTIASVENGIVTSASTMMPTGWVTHWRDWLKDHPDFDNGLHLTLTSEWKYYRWAPIVGAAQAPGLVDPDGHFWPSVMEVATHASGAEVEAEIRAQVDNAEKMGLPITHMDSHMGTIFARPDYLAAYVKVGIEKQIPIMIMGGHLTALTKTQAKMPGIEERKKWILEIAQQAWDGGLPVLDDLHTDFTSTRDLAEKKQYITDSVKAQKPGVTMYIVHCTIPSEVFGDISGTGETRHNDMLTMTDPDILQLIKDEGIILTTWKELKERRDALEKK